ncbi:flagellar hook assembly protein FlgD [Salinarimonas rosea]|uniref:flagellar hook assembly protein FlgD n=1 Tax=Salinarimonas rosea TaxID=552063 RepID=UPI0003FD947E|nr:flagellar hook assembly protein FlgD [Salinarimonas rosea]
MASGVTSAAPQAAAQSGTSEAGRDRQAIAQNFDQFLTLLTTQLQAQSPLDPLDTNQFTQQLVQFASVEQQIKTNEMLGSLLTSTRAANVSTASSFIGKRIEATGREAQLEDGKATWSLTLPRAASRAVIEIFDASGQVVATKQQALEAGKQSFVWDGRTDTGAVAKPGSYAIRVQGLDTAGQPVEVSTTFSGTVTGLDLTGADPVLISGDVRVPLAQVTGVAQS